jgi:hypothetical protein
VRPAGHRSGGGHPAGRDGALALAVPAGRRVSRVRDGDAPGRSSAGRRTTCCARCARTSPSGARRSR